MILCLLFFGPKNTFLVTCIYNEAQTWTFLLQPEDGGSIFQYSPQNYVVSQLEITMIIFCLVFQVHWGWRNTWAKTYNYSRNAGIAG
jgi:hypothetical protein